VSTSIGNILKVSSEDSEILEQWQAIHSQEITAIFLDERHKIIHSASLDDSVKAISLMNNKS
jgi:hypothetical protein